MAPESDRCFALGFTIQEARQELATRQNGLQSLNDELVAVNLHLEEVEALLQKPVKPGAQLPRAQLVALSDKEFMDSFL